MIIWSLIVELSRNQKTWHHLGGPASAEGNNTYRRS